MESKGCGKDNLVIGRSSQLVLRGQRSPQQGNWTKNRNDKTMRTYKSEQAARMCAHFEAHPNEEISAALLSQIGSGKEHGHCSSFSRRISDLRAIGMNVIKCRDEWVNGQRHTFYKFIPEQTLNQTPV